MELLTEERSKKMNNSEMINLYIEKLTSEMSELLKTKILLQTQLEFLQKSHNTLLAEVEGLRGQTDEPKVTKKRKDPQIPPQESF